MKKPNPMLAQIEARAEAKYKARFDASIDMLLQMGQDVAMIAAHEALGLGPGRAERFATAYREAMNTFARTMWTDQQSDPEFVYTQEKIDALIKSIVGPERFEPWAVRYGLEAKG